MNLHDPARRPGAHLVSEALGVEDPWMLSDANPAHDPLDLIGRNVAEAAGKVDELHGELTRLAQSAIELLEPVARGEHGDMRGTYGILRTTGPQIELLVARRGAAHEQLTRAVSVYQSLLPAPAKSLNSAEPEENLRPAHGQETEQDHDRAVVDAHALRLAALQAVEAGGLRYHEHTKYCYTFLSSGDGSRPKVLTETAEQLLADGLLHMDIGTSSYRPGQLLSLTLQGKSALQEARSITPRVSAALSRSHPDAGPRAAAPGSAPGSPARTAAKTSRSR
ncbi:hypothetical protein ACWEFL_20660 [Streptomyces sp. NPDC004838]